MTNHNHSLYRNSEINNDIPMNMNTNNNKYNSSLKYKEQDSKNELIKKEENFELEKKNSRNIETQGNEYDNNNYKIKGKMYEYSNKNEQSNHEYEPKAIYEEKDSSGNFKNLKRFENYEEKEESFNRKNYYNNNNNNNYMSENKYPSNYLDSFRRYKVNFLIKIY